MIVYGPVSPKIVSFFRQPFGSPANLRISNVPLFYSSVDLPVGFSIFATGMLRPTSNSESNRNPLYSRSCFVAAELYLHMSNVSQTLVSRFNMGQQRSFCAIFDALITALCW